VNVAPQRPKHPEPSLERVLREAEAKGWRVTKRPNRYFKMKCPCDLRHIKTVKLSPSNLYMRGNCPVRHAGTTSKERSEHYGWNT
jgi:hypothetical protein